MVIIIFNESTRSKASETNKAHLILKYSAIRMLPHPVSRTNIFNHTGSDVGLFNEACRVQEWKLTPLYFCFSYKPLYFYIRECYGKPTKLLSPLRLFYYVQKGYWSA